MSRQASHIATLQKAFKSHPRVLNALPALAEKLSDWQLEKTSYCITQLLALDDFSTEHAALILDYVDTKSEDDINAYLTTLGEFNYSCLSPTNITLLLTDRHSLSIAAKDCVPQIKDIEDSLTLEILDDTLGKLNRSIELEIRQSIRTIYFGRAEESTRLIDAEAVRNAIRREKSPMVATIMADLYNYLQPYYGHLLIPLCNAVPTQYSWEELATFIPVLKNYAWRPFVNSYTNTSSMFSNKYATRKVSILDIEFLYAFIPLIPALSLPASTLMALAHLNPGYAKKLLDAASTHSARTLEALLMPFAETIGTDEHRVQSEHTHTVAKTILAAGQLAPILIHRQYHDYDRRQPIPLKTSIETLHAQFDAQFSLAADIKMAIQAAGSVSEFCDTLSVTHIQSNDKHPLHAFYQYYLRHFKEEEYYFIQWLEKACADIKSRASDCLSLNTLTSIVSETLGLIPHHLTYHMADLNNPYIEQQPAVYNLANKLGLSKLTNWHYGFELTEINEQQEGCDHPALVYAAYCKEGPAAYYKILTGYRRLSAPFVLPELTSKVIEYLSSCDQPWAHYFLGCYHLGELNSHKASSAKKTDFESLLCTNEGPDSNTTDKALAISYFKRVIAATHHNTFHLPLAKEKLALLEPSTTPSPSLTSEPARAISSGDLASEEDKGIEDRGHHTDMPTAGGAGRGAGYV